MNENNRDGRDIPLGLSMAFGQNTDAMRVFSSLSDAGRQSVVEKARRVKSKEEMRALVAELAQNSELF